MEEVISHFFIASILSKCVLLRCSFTLTEVQKLKIREASAETLWLRPRLLKAVFYYQFSSLRLRYKRYYQS